MRRRLKKEKEELVVRVPNSFWPRFFALPQVVKFVDSTIAFCLTPARRFYSKTSGRRVLEEVTQFVFLYPESGDLSEFVPTEALFAEFPLNARGNPVSPLNLPFPYHQLRKCVGVRIYELISGKRRLFCAVPTWDLEEAGLTADSYLSLASLDEMIESDQLVTDTFLVMTSVPRGGLHHYVTLVKESIWESITRVDQGEEDADDGFADLEEGMRIAWELHDEEERATQQKKHLLN